MLDLHLPNEKRSESHSDIEIWKTYGATQSATIRHTVA